MSELNDQQSRGGILRIAVDVRKSEVQVLLGSAVYFFYILCCYYILRPLRDEISGERPEHLQYLWTGTFVVSLVIIPLYAWLVTKLPRRKLIPIIYRFMAFNIALFAIALMMVPENAQPDVADHPAKLWIEVIFYVWLSVFNVFVLAIFWGFLADIFRNEQGRRLFGLIAVGGSLGAVAGPLLTRTLIEPIGMVGMLFIAMVMLELGTQSMRATDRIIRRTESLEPESGVDEETQIESTVEVPPASSVWQGLSVVFKSPYLIGICAYLACHLFANGFVEFQKAWIASEAFESRADRRIFYADVDLITNSITLFIQIFLTGRVIRFIGIGATLTILPAITIIGFLVLGGAHMMDLSALSVVWVVAGFQIARRSGNFALTKPAREILFTVVPRAQKYQSKAFIDTALYRGGDLVIGWLFVGLKAIGLSLAVLALLGVPVAVARIVTGLWLGRRQDGLARSETAGSTEQDLATKPAE